VVGTFVVQVMVAEAVDGAALTLEMTGRVTITAGVLKTRSTQ